MEEWRIQLHDGKYFFFKYVDGNPKEAFKPVDQTTAALYAESIVNCFQIPLDLARLRKHSEHPT